METKDTLKIIISELTEALKESDSKVNSLENDVDNYVEEIDTLQNELECLKEDLCKLQKEKTLKQIREMLCDHFGLNHFTDREVLLQKLTNETPF